jgi:pimeloyl-ACP methyl ester carboxylesterase
VPFTPLADLIAVLDHLAVSAAVVVGHSGGGGTALGLAIAEPERVSALVLLAPGVPDYPWPEDDRYFAEFDALLSAGDRQGLVALARRTWASDDHDPAVEEQLRSATAAYAEQGDLMQSGPPILDRLNTIGVPVTILIGEEDHPMVIECASAIAARLATCQTAMLPGVYHMLPLRVPDLVAATLTVR